MFKTKRIGPVLSAGRKKMAIFSTLSENFQMCLKPQYLGPKFQQNSHESFSASSLNYSSLASNSQK